MAKKLFQYVLTRKNGAHEFYEGDALVHNSTDSSLVSVMNGTQTVALVALEPGDTIGERTVD
jgi:hypothetical protein